MVNQFNVKGFIPASMLDWPGKISSVVFLGRCNFRCPACHNPGLVLEPDAIPDFPLEEILAYLESRDTWIDGVTVTGGEPTASQSLPTLLEIFKWHGLGVKLDTNGSNPAMLEELIRESLVDAVSMDVKAPINDHEYSRVAGVKVNHEIIARSIAILKECALDVTFRTTVIPGLVEEPELVRITSFLGRVSRYQIQAFRNAENLDPEFSLLNPFNQARLEEMRALFEIPSQAELRPERYAYPG
jgi:pyruvate formate lyase activating enzyme